MIGSQLHDFEIRVVRYVLSNLVQQVDDPAYVACLERRLAPTLFAYLRDFAAKDSAAVPTVLLNEKELEQLRAAVSDAWDFDGTWQNWEPLHRLSINCVPEIRQHLTQHHAEEWATVCERFAQRLTGDGVRLRDGIETVSEWIDEIHRLLKAMGVTALLPRPEGRFPTPSCLGDPEQLPHTLRITLRKKSNTPLLTSADKVSADESRPGTAGMLTPSQVSAKFTVSRSTVYAACRSGSLSHYRVPARKAGRGKYLIQEQDLLAWLESLKVTSGVPLVSSSAPTSSGSLASPFSELNPKRLSRAWKKE